MPAVANPITFGGSSRNYGYNPPSRVEFDDLPYLQTPGRTRGVPTYTVGGGSGQPIRPGVGLGAGQGTTIVSGSSPISYNPNTRNNSFDVADDEYGPISTEDMLKAAATDQLLLGGVGALSAGLLGQNLTGVDLGGGFLGQIPYLGRGLKELDYFLNPTYANARDASGFLGGTARYIKDFPGRVENAIGPNSIFGGGGTGPKYAGGSIGGSPISLTNTLSSIGSGIGAFGQRYADTLNLTNMGQQYGGITNTATPLYKDAAGNIQSSTQLAAKDLYNKTIGKLLPDTKFNMTAVENVPTDAKLLNNKEYSGISGFFNQPRSFIPGVSGTGASATGFGGGGVPGQGITSIGNVLGTVGGLFSLADFIDDPSLASGLGTLAGAGASGIGAFSGLATAAPWLAGAALVASLLGNKKPSNKTGYTSIDLDEFKPVSFGMEGKKYSKENVDQTMQIMEPLIPAIQQLEEQYGVDLKGDIQVNYGGRDGLAYNIGNRDVTGFRNRLDYFDGRDQSTRDGGSIYRKTFKGENAGKDFYTSLLGDLEALAKQKQADGGGEIDLANYRGVQRQAPQMTGAFSYGLPGGTPNVATPPKPKGGPQGVFTYGYNT